MLDQPTVCLNQFINTYSNVALPQFASKTAFWAIFCLGVTLTFYLVTPKSNQFIIVPKCTNPVSLIKFHQQLFEILALTRYTSNLISPLTTFAFECVTPKTNQFILDPYYTFLVGFYLIMPISFSVIAVTKFSSN